MIANINYAYDDCTSNVHDCLGECDGTAVVDDCGECDGGNATQDCAGECYGSAYEDECGECDDDTSNDCVQDCAGEWGGSAAYGTYYLDADSDGLGEGSYNTYCSDFVPAGCVTNSDDNQPDFFTNDGLNS